MSSYMVQMSDMTSISLDMHYKFSANPNIEVDQKLKAIPQFPLLASILAIIILVQNAEAIFWTFNTQWLPLKCCSMCLSWNA